VNTAEYITSLIAGRIVELAIAGGVWSLFYSQRILFAASPKPQQPPQAGDAKAKDKLAARDEPAEQPQADSDEPFSILGGKSTGEAA
jgi:hypothetical protein